MGEKILRKTGILVGWGRVNQVPLAHLVRLWLLYVGPIVVAGCSCRFPLPRRRGWTCFRAKRAVSCLAIASAHLGLRAGDSCDNSPTSRCNCCLFCLEHGSLVSDSLHHFLCDCPLSTVADVGSTDDLTDLLLHPDAWLTAAAARKRAVMRLVSRKGSIVVRG
eukprot:s1512_g6.t1